MGPRLCLAVAWAAWTIEPTLDRNDEGPGISSGPFFFAPPAGTAAGGAGPANGLVIAHIGPQSPLARLMLGQHRHRGVVAVHAIAGEHVGADELVERAQQEGAAANLVRKRRDEPAGSWRPALHLHAAAAKSVPNEEVLPLLFAAATARELGVPSVGLVSPYLAYMRQDRRFKPGEAVTSREVAKLLSDAVDWLVTVDRHLHRYGSLAEIYRIPPRLSEKATCAVPSRTLSVQCSRVHVPSKVADHRIFSARLTQHFPIILLVCDRGNQ